LTIATAVAAIWNDQFSTRRGSRFSVALFREGTTRDARDIAERRFCPKMKITNSNELWLRNSIRPRFGIVSLAVLVTLENPQPVDIDHTTA
jgi:hypothetical protein